MNCSCWFKGVHTLHQQYLRRQHNENLRIEYYSVDANKEHNYTMPKRNNNKPHKTRKWILNKTLIFWMRIAAACTLRLNFLVCSFWKDQNERVKKMTLKAYHTKGLNVFQLNRKKKCNCLPVKSPSLWLWLWAHQCKIKAVNDYQFKWISIAFIVHTAKVAQNRCSERAAIENRSVDGIIILIEKNSQNTFISCLLSQGFQWKMLS